MTQKADKGTIIIPDLDTLNRTAMQTLQKFLQRVNNEEEVSGREVSMPRVASSVISTYVRSQQVERARDQMNISLARNLAKEDGEFQKYLRITAPKFVPQQPG